MIKSISIIAILVCIALGIGFIYSIAKLCKELIGKERVVCLSKKTVCGLLVSLVILGLTFMCMYFIPLVFLDMDSWKDVSSTNSKVTTIALISAIATFTLGYIYFIMSYITIKKSDIPYMLLGVFGVISGLGYSFVVSIVNTALSESFTHKSYLLLYFVLGLCYYVFAQKIVRIQLAKVTNDMIYDIRVKLVKKILNSSFYKFEKIGNERVYASLNNDTEIISNSIGVIVKGITSIVIFLCSYVYLGILSLKALVTATIILLVIGVVLVTMSKSAEKFWSRTRDIQNVFYRFINDLVNGIKELSLNKAKSEEFKDDMSDSCDKYRKNCVDAELVATNVYFINELLVFFLLGGLIFIFPMFFSEVKYTVLADYVLIFLFLKGPLDCIIDMINKIQQIKVSYRRLMNLDKLLQESQVPKVIEKISDKVTNLVDIELKNVEYEYHSESNYKFTLGPINCKFNSGEITFITGGNGSGKSTLAKLITGLYAPNKGNLYINDNKLLPEEIGQYFSTVFSDYYIFEKLYGVDYKSKQNEANEYLELLKISDKLEIKNGTFSTIKLSTGQKKRLALLVSYLEDKSIYLFDEWAADQDPEFRKYFYTVLLPELKAKGKCVIAITHDDRYFDLADKVIKMESGKISETVIKENVI